MAPTQEYMLLEFFLSLQDQGKYVFQGKSKLYNDKDRSGWTDEVQFAATGELYDKLCAVDGDGLCTFPSTVTLDEAALLSDHRSSSRALQIDWFSPWPPEALPLQHQWRGEMVTAANNSKANDYSNTPLTQDPCE